MVGIPSSMPSNTVFFGQLRACKSVSESQIRKTCELTSLAGKLHIWMCEPRMIIHGTFQVILPLVRKFDLRLQRCLISKTATWKKILTCWCCLVGTREHTVGFKIGMRSCKEWKSLVGLKHLPNGLMFVGPSPGFLYCCDVFWFCDWCTQPIQSTK